MYGVLLVLALLHCALTMQDSSPELNNTLGLRVTEPIETVSEGQNISFTCTSDETTVFQWNFNKILPLPNNTMIENFEKHSVLTITDVKMSNRGRYFCVGQGNISRSTDSNLSKLYVYPPYLKISVHPKETIVDEGDNVTVFCTLDCFCRGATLSWKRGYNDILLSNAVVTYGSHPTRAILHISSVQLRDCNLYTCLGKFGSVERVQSTQLIVNEVFKVMLSTDSNIMAEVGSNQIFICSSKFIVSNWQWSFNGGSELPQLVEVFNLPTNRSLLYIHSVQPIHVGLYQCQGTSITGEIARDATLLQIEPTPTSSTSSLSPTMTPSTTELSTSVRTDAPSTSSSSSLSISSSLTFSSLSGTITSSLTTFSSASSGFTSMRTDAPSTLSSSSSSISSSPTTSSLSDTTTSSLSPTMTPTPTELLTPSVSDDNLELLPGEDANVTCTSNIKADIEWSFTGSMFPSNVRSVQTSSTSAVLVITDFNDNNKGSYRCLAQANGVQKGVLILINAKETLEVEVTPQSHVMAVNDESEVHVTCRLDCACGGASVKWRFGNGSRLLEKVAQTTEKVTQTISFSKRSSRLEFTEMTLELGGEYICIATLGSTTAHKSFFLQVLIPAAITVTPSEIMVPRDGKVELTCIANRNISYFTWSYQTRNMALPPNARNKTINKTVSVLTVEDVQRNVNDGQYFCEGKFAGTGEILSNTGNVIQITELALKLSPTAENNTYQFGVSAKISIRCGVNCPCDGAKAEWRSNNEQFPVGLTTRRTTDRAVHLESTSDSGGATLGMGGVYQCRVFNAEDSIFQNITIIVISRVS